MSVFILALPFQRKRLAYERNADLYTDVKADQEINAQAVGHIGDKTGWTKSPMGNLLCVIRIVK